MTPQIQILPKCKCGGMTLDNASGGITRTCIHCCGTMSIEKARRIWEIINDRS